MKPWGVCILIWACVILFVNLSIIRKSPRMKKANICETFAVTLLVFLSLTDVHAFLLYFFTFFTVMTITRWLALKDERWRAHPLNFYFYTFLAFLMLWLTKGTTLFL